MKKITFKFICSRLFGLPAGRQGKGCINICLKILHPPPKVPEGKFQKKKKKKKYVYTN